MPPISEKAETPRAARRKQPALFRRLPPSKQAGKGTPAAREKKSPASPDELPILLHDMNPWWSSARGPDVPSMRRWAFPTLLRKMDLGLAPAVLLRGSRQVGKTTLQEQIIRELLSKRKVNPRRILRAQFDDLHPLRRAFDSPVLELSRWFQREVMGRPFNEAAREDGPAYLFFDEVQNLDNWAPQIKHLVDHNRGAVKVVVTGSSALRIKAGQDSLSGRVAVVELDVLHLSEIAALRGDDSLSPMLKDNNVRQLREKDFWRELREHGIRGRAARDRAFDAFTDRGGYPLAHINAKAPWEEVAGQLTENIVHRVIRHDLRAGETGGRKRDEPLLDAVFRVACRYCGQAPSLVAEITEEVRRDVGGGGGGAASQKVRYYLDFLRDTMLMHLVEPPELRLQKRRSGAKICLSDHSLRAAWLGEKINLSPRAKNPDPDVAGHIAESIAGAFLAALPNTMLNHFPERNNQPEVDFILTIGDNRIPIEIKYRRTVHKGRDTAGLLSFVENSRGRAPFGILVTRDDEFQSEDPRIVALPLSSLLLLR